MYRLYTDKQIMDIKELIENKMDDMRISRAEVCRRLKIAPQGWAKKLTDPKWSTIESVCEALNIKPIELFQPKEETSSLIECPHCHKVIKLKAEKI